MGRRELRSVRKPVTTSAFLCSNIGVTGMTDIGKPVENVVFLELMRRGYTLRVGSFKDAEVDFTDTREREGVQTP